MHMRICMISIFCGCCCCCCWPGIGDRNPAHWLWEPWAHRCERVTCIYITVLMNCCCIGRRMLRLLCSKTFINTSVYQRFHTMQTWDKRCLRITHVNLLRSLTTHVGRLFSVSVYSSVAFDTGTSDFISLLTHINMTVLSSLKHSLVYKF